MPQETEQAYWDFTNASANRVPAKRWEKKHFNFHDNFFSTATIIILLFRNFLNWNITRSCFVVLIFEGTSSCSQCTAVVHFVVRAPLTPVVQSDLGGCCPPLWEPLLCTIERGTYLATEWNNYKRNCYRQHGHRCL